MDVSIRSIARYGRRHRPIRVDVRITSGLPGIAISGASIGAIRGMADQVRTTLETAGWTWPLDSIRVAVRPYGPPDALRDIELPLLVALILAARPGADQADAMRDLSAWGAVPARTTGAEPVATALLCHATHSHGDTPRYDIRPVLHVDDLWPMLAMTNGPP
jgi:predicted ATPase with chaperone activity